MVRKLYWTDVENETAKTRDCGHGQRHSEMTLQQITLHRTEVLKLLRHVHEIKTALSRSFDRYYQHEFDDLEDQLLTMKSEVDQLLFYFESQHQMGINIS